MLNTYDNFTLNSIFRPEAFIKKEHALKKVGICNDIPTFKKKSMKASK